MKNRFMLDEKKEYLLYGAGGNGLNLIPVFKKAGYYLKGFIDKRAASIENVQGEDVWSLDTLKELEAESDNIVIIITTKNVFEHTNIVYELAKMGFNQCIYKPLPVLKGYSDEELEKISKAHDVFMVDRKIPEPQEYSKVQNNNKMYYKDRLFIGQQDENLSVWLPLELLFNYREADAYENISMAAFFPLDNLYRLFLGNAGENEKEILDDFYCYAFEWAYRNQVDVTRELQISWVESRKAAFSQMQEIVDYDFDFFIRNAPQVEMQDLGKFHMVCSGRNRVVFLSAKGYHHVPVKLSSEDYKKWINKEVFFKLQNYIEKERVVKVFAPIAHPYLKDLPSDNINYYSSVCFSIANYIFCQIYRNARKEIGGYSIVDKNMLTETKEAYSILCDVSDDGACSRYLHTCGFHVIRTDSNNEFVNLLDELFYQTDIDTTKDKYIEYCSLLIIDDIVKIDCNIIGRKINQIIFVGSNKRSHDILAEKGYIFERTLSSIFNIAEVKQVAVYNREK